MRLWGLVRTQDENVLAQPVGRNKRGSRAADAAGARAAANDIWLEFSTAAILVMLVRHGTEGNHLVSRDGPHISIDDGAGRKDFATPCRIGTVFTGANSSGASRDGHSQSADGRP